jgi:hypothetical protein
MVTPEDKKSLKYISALQQIEKELQLLEEAWHKAVLTRQLIEKTILHADATVRERANTLLLQAEADNPADFDNLSKVDWEVQAQRVVHLPKVQEAVAGLELEYRSTMDILPADYNRLASFLDRNPDENRWFAPQEARDASGTLLPLSQRYETICLKNLKIKGPVARLTKEEKEALAWRWLIISHNHANPKSRVPLPTKLSIAYERGKTRKVAEKGNSAAMELSKAVEEFRKTIVSVTPAPAVPSVPKSSVEAFLTVLLDSAKAQLQYGCDWDAKTATFTVKPGKSAYEPQAERWNRVMALADNLMEDQPVVAPPVSEFSAGELEAKIDKFLSSSQPEPVEPSIPVNVTEEEEEGSLKEWELLHPEFIEVNGVTFFRNDIQILDVAEGQEFRTVIHEGLEYYSVQGEAAGPAKTSKARGKTATRPLSPPTKPVKVDGKKEKKEEKGKLPPVAQENPLRVKGEPKSKALSQAERDTLRKFFKLKENRVPSDEWAAMDSKARSIAMAERSIPKWASEAVLRKSSNLQLILEGKLTKENAQQAPRDPTKITASKANGQAMEAWQQLKAEFKGVPLLKKPQSQREKAFKKRFDALVATYGQQPCFPKLKERPDQQGRSPSRGRSKSSGAGADFLEMAKAFGEIARAFSGRSN